MVKKRKQRDPKEIRPYRTNYERVYENVNATLRFMFVATGNNVQFPAYIVSHSDSFTANWNTEQVYGRMDPIANYQNTERTISVSFTIPAYNLTQAQDHLKYLSELATYMYPVMDKSNGVGNINTAPLIRLQFANLIIDTSTNQGLLGFIEGGLNIEWVQEEGFFIVPAGRQKERILPKLFQNFVDSSIQRESMIYPKSINISFNFRVLHPHKLGWDNDMPNKFPYMITNDFHDAKRAFEEYEETRREAKRLYDDYESLFLKVDNDPLDRGYNKSNWKGPKENIKLITPKMQELLDP